eukprot:Em0003g266a
MPTSKAAPNVTALNAVTALSNTADPFNPSVPNGDHHSLQCPSTQYSFVEAACTTAGCQTGGVANVTTLDSAPVGQAPPHPQYHILFHVPPMECSPPTRLCHHCLTLHHRVPSLSPSQRCGHLLRQPQSSSMPTTPSGILFYQINSVITDFLGVKMHGGLPWLIFDVGSGPAVVGSNSTRTFIDGQWHTGHVVLFEQASNTFYVTVDTVHAAAITDVIVPLLTMKVYFEGFPSTRADMALQTPYSMCLIPS